ncbi:unnamed protein product, partial [Rotaria magnacalcarata]
TIIVFDQVILTGFENYCVKIEDRTTMANLNDYGQPAADLLRMDAGRTANEQIHDSARILFDYRDTTRFGQDHSNRIANIRFSNRSTPHYFRSDQAGEAEGHIAPPTDEVLADTNEDRLGIEDTQPHDLEAMIDLNSNQPPVFLINREDNHANEDATLYSIANENVIPTGLQIEIGQNVQIQNNGDAPEDANDDLFLINYLDIGNSIAYFYFNLNYL